MNSDAKPELSKNIYPYSRWWLYILELEQGKWYVGITSKNPQVRFEEHKLGKRAAYWTMKFKPVRIESYEDLGVVSREHAESYENKITRQLMKERGLNNVRGGDLTGTVEYVRRFGYFYTRENWRDLVYILCMLVLIALYSIHIFIHPFIPATPFFK